MRQDLEQLISSIPASPSTGLTEPPEFKRVREIISEGNQLTKGKLNLNLIDIFSGAPLHRTPQYQTTYEEAIALLSNVTQRYVNFFTPLPGGQHGSTPPENHFVEQAKVYDLLIRYDENITASRIDDALQNLGALEILAQKQNWHKLRQSALIKKAMLQQEQGDYHSAISTLNPTAISSSAKGLALRGKLKYEWSHGNDRSALEDLKKSYELSSDNKEVNAMLANIYSAKIGTVQEADYRQNTTQRVSDYDTAVNKLVMGEDFSGAQQIFNNIISQVTGNQASEKILRAKSYHGLACIAKSIGRKHDAYQLINKSLRQAETNNAYEFLKVFHSEQSK